MDFENPDLVLHLLMTDHKAPDRQARTLGTELRDIEIFLTLADELHFGRAAERLYVSQTRVSQTIRQIETRIGGRLFDRSSRRVQLTALGEQLRDALRPPYDQIHQAFATVRAAAGGITGALRISLLSAVAGGPAFADITRAFRTHHPGCEVTVFEAFPGEALGRLRRGELDLMVHWLPLAEAGLTVGPLLLREERALAVPEQHVLAVRGHATLEDLGDLAVPDAVGIVPEETLVALCPRSTPSGRPIRRGAREGRVAEVLVQVARGEVVYPSTASLARYYAHPGVTVIPLLGLPPLESALVWATDRETPAVNAFAATAKELVAL
jgi:DNA-binding transcriptional LysR family regulator